MKSNCLIEAIKAYVSDPVYVRIQVVLPSKREIMRGEFIPHFYWMSLRYGKCYHYHTKRYLNNLQCFWFDGKVEEIDFKADHFRK